MFPPATTFSYRPHLPGRALCRSPHPVATMLRGGRGVEKSERGLHIVVETARNARKEYLSTFDPRFSPIAGIRKVAARSQVGLRPRNSLRRAASTPYPIDSHINPLHHVEIRLPDRRAGLFGVSQLTGPHGPVKRWSSTDGSTRAEMLTAREREGIPRPQIRRPLSSTPQPRSVVGS